MLHVFTEHSVYACSLLVIGVFASQNERKQKWVDERLPKLLQQFEDLATPTGFIAGKKVKI